MDIKNAEKYLEWFESYQSREEDILWRNGNVKNFIQAAKIVEQKRCIKIAVDHLCEVRNIMESWKREFKIKRTWPPGLHPADILEKHFLPQIYEKFKRIKRKNNQRS